jgi:recombinational DNA repair ATPase RecF
LKVGVVSDRSHLEEISIRSIGVIDQSSLELSPGLNVLTGETGAGKTMILTALQLVLGGKSDSSLVRQGSERLLASARFSVNKTIADIAIESGADVEDGTLILTRTVNADGKSKAVAGGASVPAATLVALHPRPLLSFHCVTFDPETVSVVASAPSNHKAHPAMSVGRTMAGAYRKGCVPAGVVSPHFHARYPSTCWRWAVDRTEL